MASGDIIQSKTAILDDSDSNLTCTFFNAAGGLEGTPTLEADLQIDTMPVIDGVEMN